MTDTKNLLLPALIAAGGGLAAMPASALQLADMKVQSTLGQPLRASIAYALNPNEEIAKDCVSVQPALQHNGVPAVSGARVSVANGVIRLTGTMPVSEPIMSLRVNIRCPYTPQLSREFTLLIDPAGTQETNAAPVAVATARRTSAKMPVAAPAAPAGTPGETVARSVTAATAGNDRYLVQPGDSLSAIAQKLRGSNVGLWSAATQIHAANPHAFIDNDPNRLQAGTWLAIPAFDESSQSFATRSPAADAAQPVRQEAAAPVRAADRPDESSASPVATGGSNSAPAAVADRVMSGMAIGAAGLPARGESRPLVNETIPLPGRASPNVPVARITPAQPVESTIPGTLWWLVGGGVALFVGLLSLFRRSGRTLLSPAPDEIVETHPLRRATDTQKVEPVVADDYALSDNCPTAENLALDADLELGTGLDTGVDIAVTEDFGFSTSADLDLEFPEESVNDDDSGPLHQTDIISAPQREQSSILESEILPDDDEYDMSVVMDATKMPETDAVTERDLKAVVVDDRDPTLNDSYTISQEGDYQILEQDYEEPLSATQALNLEIERAAAEFADRLDAEIAAEHRNSSATSEETALMPLASVTRLEPMSRDSAEGTADDEGESGAASVSHEDITAEIRSPKGSKAG